MAAIALSDDEALVLFAWLSERSEAFANDHRPSAEDVALWNLEALLEKQLAAPQATDYAERLAAARARLLAI
ncbi:MAG: hypothetical protein V4466_16545 [Pseudomonadota bacterium]